LRQIDVSGYPIPSGHLAHAGRMAYCGSTFMITSWSSKRRRPARKPTSISTLSVGLRGATMRAAGSARRAGDHRPSNATAVQGAQVSEGLARSGTCRRDTRRCEEPASRARGVTEGSDAGADLEHLRHHASHSSITTTARYGRKTWAKTSAVARLRVAIDR
jgi:hypothetical protein